MGVATATATFFRSVGGSFGVALFGAIFASRLADQLKLLPASSGKVLGRRPLNPEQAKHLPPEVHAQFLHAFSHALNGVFIWGMAIAMIPFALSWFLKEVPLRTTVHRASEPAVGATEFPCPRPARCFSL